MRGGGQLSSLTGVCAALRFDVLATLKSLQFPFFLVQINHYVLLVGYFDTGYWIVRNSWCVRGMGAGGGVGLGTCRGAAAS